MPNMKNIGLMIANNEKKILFLIFLAALALRVSVVLNLPGEYMRPSADAADYDNYATDILAGKGFVNHMTGLHTSYHAPLYPVFLALIYLLFGLKNYFAVMIIQCVMSACLPVIIFYIGKAMFNDKVGLLSAFWLAFYKPYIIFSSQGGPAFLLSENLFNVLFLLTALFMLKRAFVAHSLKDKFILGILFGILILTRAVLALYPAILAFLIYKNRQTPASAIKEISVFFAAIAIVILPWTARNYFVHRAFVPLTTQGGFGLISGNNRFVNGGGQTDMKRMLTPEQKSQYDKMNEVEKDKFLKKVAVDFMIKNYRQIPRACIKKISVLWDVFVNDYDLVTGSCVRRYNVWYSIVFMFSLFGIAKAVRPQFNINILFFLSFFLYTTIIVVITGGDPRHRYYFEPLLIVLASLGIFTIYNGFKRKIFAYTAIGAIIGINLIFYLYSGSFLGLIRCAWRLL